MSHQLKLENPVSVAPPDSERKFRLAHLIPLLFVLVSIAYVAQIASPLRLTNDRMDYLSQASSAIDGRGFVLRDGTRSMRPSGYPAPCMERVNWALRIRGRLFF